MTRPARLSFSSSISCCSPWRIIMDGRQAALFLFLASLLVLLSRPAASVTSGIVLNDFIRHFEPLFYDHDDVRQQHSRAKRESQSPSTPSSSELRLQFHAHNRLFKIRLRRSASVFAEDAVLENTHGPISYDKSKIYHGELEDDDQSTVSAVLTSSGYLDATVSTVSETYYIEPASRYFGNSVTTNGDGAANESFPGVIYKASDVIHPDPHDGDSCSSHLFYLKQFEESHRLLSRQRFNQTSPAVIDSCHHHSHDHDDNLHHHNVAPGNELPADQLIDRTLYSGWDRRSHHQHRRKKSRRASSSSSANTIDPRKTTCMLYLQADHLFYSKLGSEDASIETMTRHVQRVNAIYKNIDFDGDGEPDDINFMIKRIKVHTTSDDPGYRYPGNYGVEKFLELFSEEDYNAFCLAYMFTYRDFEGGTLGLAWTGDLKNAGGVCEKNGHYRGSLKSLNTGIVTLLNYGKHVPPAVSHVTLAHEIGHNFGSPHDPENNRDCTPGGEDGNYIMFARATSGDKKNNNKFSPCSLKSINGVLSAKARNDVGCFTEPQSAICGNGVVEAGEECDCGWEEDCKEKCCYPMRSVQMPNEKPCTLRRHMVCSPSQGPCCTEDCHLRYDVKCRDDNGCRDAAYCDGTGPKCPDSNNKPNKTVCSGEFVCFMGECTGSICIAYGLQSCQCLQGPNDPPTKACELCCKLPGDDQPCLSSFEWNSSPYDVPDAHAKAGTPCNNYNGYCDVFQRCREVDPSGPLATLRRLLLSDESIASLKKWIEEHWYGVMFIAVGFITVIVVIARVFGKRAQQKTSHRHRTSRTTNGVTTAAAAAATAAAVDESANQHIVHPVAVRTKIPLKRKVREKEKRAGRKAYSKSKALSVFRKPMSRNKHRSDPTERRRRSGVVSTKEKVRSWLERENPTHENIDSDNESHFPEEENAAPVAVTPSAPPLAEKKNGQTRRHSTNVQPTIESSITHDLPRKASQPNLNSSELLRVPSFTSRHPEPNTGPPKMMRSISENTRGREVRHANFSRSISQNHHDPDFRRLSRKTESHSHLLSKSELEIDVKSCDPDSPQTDELSPDDSIQQLRSEAVVTQHPAVQKKMNKPGQIPKSATESHLKSAGNDLRAAKKHSRFSTDFSYLNALLGRASPTRQVKSSGTRTRPNALTTDDGPSNKIRKKIGIGPVKVVLKWHGGVVGNRSKRPSNSHAVSSKDDKGSRAKKRVIVYKNGNPTPGASFAERTEHHPKPEVRDKDCVAAASVAAAGNGKEKVNITANPLNGIESANVKSKRISTDYGHQNPLGPKSSQVTKDRSRPVPETRPTSNAADSAALSRSRRYSMQERHAQPPPSLMRRVSEIHPNGGASVARELFDNKRRNRHSWTSTDCTGALPEVVFPSSSPEQISIDIEDSDQAED